MCASPYTILMGIHGMISQGRYNSTTIRYDIYIYIYIYIYWGGSKKTRRLLTIYIQYIVNDYVQHEYIDWRNKFTQFLIHPSCLRRVVVSLSCVYNTIHTLSLEIRRFKAHYYMIVKEWLVNIISDITFSINISAT